MKIQLVAACVAAGILAGCGDSDDGPLPNSQQVQAFDGAIQGMAGTYDCGDGAETGTLPKTEFDGYTTVTGAADSLLVTNPGACSFTFNPTPGAVDVSNGKDMSQLSLKLPVGLGVDGSLQANPVATLVAEAMEEQGAEYSESLATEVLTSLGLSDALNTVSVTQLLTDLDGAIEALEAANPAEASKVVATTHVLADVLVEQQLGNVDFTAQEAANAAVNVTETVIAENPDYPEAADGSGDIVVDAKKTVQDNEALVKKDPSEVTEEEKNTIGSDVEEAPSEPVDPPPTGGTGSGSGSGGSGGGGD